MALLKTRKKKKLKFFASIAASYLLLLYSSSCVTPVPHYILYFISASFTNLHLVPILPIMIFD